MKEHFIITLPATGNNYTSKYSWNILICIILSIVIIYPILGFDSVSSILCGIILFFILFVILSSISNENLSNELPSTLYPSLPHTGLDGISLNSYVAGTNINI
jgi:hypothetical protein